MNYIVDDLHLKRPSPSSALSLLSVHCLHRYLLVCFYYFPSNSLINIFSIVIHIFRNLSWKICPLFGQILIMCLKCSSTSFSSSSYSEKMRWGEGWVILSPSNKVGLVCFNESPLKMMNNFFYFILKVFFILKIFTFLPWLFWLCRKTAW